MQQKDTRGVGSRRRRRRGLKEGDANKGEDKQRYVAGGHRILYVHSITRDDRETTEV